MKKTVAAVAVAVGLTVSATGSYAGSAPDTGSASDAAVVRAQKQVEQASRALVDAQAADKSGHADAARRQCVSVKKMKTIRVFMPYKKVMNKLPRPSRKSKSGSLRFRYWNTCLKYGDDDFSVTFKKRKGKWTSSDVGVYWYQ